MHYGRTMIYHNCYSHCLYVLRAVNNTSTAGLSGGSQRGRPQQKSYQTPAAALYGSSQEAGSSGTSCGHLVMTVSGI